MRIVIDVPEWAQGRHIYIMAGIEMLAYKLYGEDAINIKTARCQMCGECCQNLKPHAGVPLDDKGNCIYLTPIGPKWECSLGVFAPFGCLTGMQRRGKHLSCTVEYGTLK